MTGTELDDILADEPQETTQEQTTTDTSVARDDQGRFAQKVEAQPEVTAEPIALNVEELPNQEHGAIPPAALAASRQKARDFGQENETLKTQLAQLQGQVELLTRQQTQQPAAPVEPEKAAPDFWENPDAYLSGKLEPVQKQIETQRDQFSRMLAETAHGAETVGAAYAAFANVPESPARAAQYAAIKQAANPYAALVEWHQRHQTLQTVGSDPKAWLEAEIEKRLSDPAHQGKILERIRGTAQQNTNRSNPLTNLPPSLTRLPAGGNAPGEADMSDAGLFSHATR